jgi:hypothetical protein
MPGQREEPFSKRERAELAGYVSVSTVAGRAALFLAALTIVGVLSRRVQQALGMADPLWLVPTGVAGALLYVRARRWTGGADFRRRVRRDLEANTVLVHHIRVRDAILFEEQEDEGPIVFVQTDTGETLVFTGQELARHVSRGFPWREFEIRETPHSRRFLRLKRGGEPLAPSLRRPPLSAESYNQLGLGAVRSWQRLEIPFDRIRQIA